MNVEHIITALLTSPLTGGVIFYIVGKIMKAYPPNWPNYYYGYRTMSSLKTKETFDAANQFSAVLMIRYGIWMMVAGIICTIFFYEKYWYLYLGITVGALVASAALLIIKTEKHLSKHFDKSGKPRAQKEDRF
jgi:uncharacterized membrane protein